MIDQQRLNEEKQVIDEICSIFNKQVGVLTNLQVIGILESLKFFFMSYARENKGIDDEHQ